MSAREREYLETLRRLPPSVVLDVAGRDLDMDDGEKCLCGWAIRVALGEAVGKDAAAIARPVSLLLSLSQRFGGTLNDWQAIYYGSAGLTSGPEVEAAFRERVLECVDSGNGGTFRPTPPGKAPKLVFLARSGNRTMVGVNGIAAEVSDSFATALRQAILDGSGMAVETLTLDPRIAPGETVRLALEATP